MAPSGFTLGVASIASLPPLFSLLCLWGLLGSIEVCCHSYRPSLPVSSLSARWELLLRVLALIFSSAVRRRPVAWPFIACAFIMDGPECSENMAPSVTCSTCGPRDSGQLFLYLGGLFRFLLLEG